jgi:ABC-2 type transport system ATP-binding protein
VSDLLLRAVSVRKSLGTTFVLDDVSLDVHRGAIVGLLGANGAGKTTLIRIVIGLLRADHGTVAGPAAPGTGAVVGYLPEERGLYQRHTAQATLRYLAELKGLRREDADAEVARCLALVEMASFAARRIDRMSKGQQQRIQLAAAWLGDPDLLVLDEPFSGLDPLNARLVCDLAREAASRGRGVLISAHQLALVAEICTHIVMLARGRVAVSAGAGEFAQRGATLEQLFVEHAGGEQS